MNREYCYSPRRGILKSKRKRNVESNNLHFSGYGVGWFFFFICISDFERNSLIAGKCREDRKAHRRKTFVTPSGDNITCNILLCNLLVFIYVYIL